MGVTISTSILMIVRRVRSAWIPTPTIFHTSSSSSPQNDMLKEDQRRYFDRVRSYSYTTSPSFATCLCTNSNSKSTGLVGLPPTYSYHGTLTCEPSSRLFLLNSYFSTIPATASSIMSSACCVPGHILLPNPNPGSNWSVGYLVRGARKAGKAGSR